MKPKQYIKSCSLSRTILFSIICLCGGLFGISSEAKNTVYKGESIIIDQPDGELKYFKAKLNGIQISRGSSKLDSFSKEFIATVVFAPDGKVFIRNILPSNYFSQGVPVWTEGEISEDGSFIFHSGCPIYFVTTNAMGGYSDCIYYLYPALYIPEAETSITIDEDIETISFAFNQDSSYKLTMGNNTGIYFYGNYPSSYMYMVTEYTLTPMLEITKITPPDGFEPEKYQIDFNGFTDIALNMNPTTSSFLVNVVRTPTEIYIQGLSNTKSGDPELWMRGEIRGDKVVFKNEECLGAGRNNYMIYFTSLAESGKANERQRMNGTTLSRFYNPTYQDLTFDYNPSTGTLSNPSSDFGLITEPNSRVGLATSPENWNDQYMPIVDFYHNPTLFKVQENYEYEPKTPTAENKNYPRQIEVDYRDWNGQMMNPENLFIEVKVDGEPVSFDNINMNTWEQETSSLYPFYSSYIINFMGSNGYKLGSPYSIYLPSFPYSGEITYNLIYKEGDVTYESTPFPAELKSIGTHLSPMDDAPVFDLTGRPIADPQSYKGIMIREGRKIVR